MIPEPHLPPQSHRLGEIASGVRGERSRPEVAAVHEHLGRSLGSEVSMLRESGISPLRLLCHACLTYW